MGHQVPVVLEPPVMSRLLTDPPSHVARQAEQQSSGGGTFRTRPNWGQRLKSEARSSLGDPGRRSFKQNPCLLDLHGAGGTCRAGRPGAERRGCQGARDPLTLHPGPAPGFPRRLLRLPAAGAPTQPHSPPPRACAPPRAPPPPPPRARARARGPGRELETAGPAAGRRTRAESAGSATGRGGSAGADLAAGGGRRRPPASGPGRGAEREGRAPRAGGHGREPEAAAAAAAAGPAGGEARGPRPLTPPAARRAPAPPGGAVAKQRLARPPIPRCPFFPGRV
ncbi:translation initiation factor IF-2-like [Rhinolophus ferrumequinum]|uniref:translation initiation factor IF-2-like n=1 Tax=Rhinolophus ferrumequinum TaxID=59479 RepID=UPI00140FCF0D|nr:translation initiation factor IF-2-like [Rhinolophus ferrumequinum]